MVGLNPGYRHHLRLAADALVAGIDEPEPTLIDLGCGTGLSTRALLDAAIARGLTPRIVGVDASPGMLARARAGDWPGGVEFVDGRAEQLGELGLPAADGVLACYLLRNVTDLPATLAAIRAALRPGSPFVAEDSSVTGFASVPDLCRAMAATGFVEIAARTVPGWQHRILHVIRARSAPGLDSEA
ncbi:ubiquinone/menaquinone biosynthesis C-methylase UbiE [Naumannella cuiyingiana]|uniref:Ubiquinone/menaquinone biosynthesis C-methylase UbiE n=2 Tax=Naumannella cuiyingiana TaxID=1347891 RepID=A0A7Z0IKG5_9ACTN|nr:ubiquinone/menaquinone biosynthesis C-methylase UbiE [Naumannella cuiyingiana]